MEENTETTKLLTEIENSVSVLKEIQNRLGWEKDNLDKIIAEIKDVVDLIATPQTAQNRNNSENRPII